MGTDDVRKRSGAMGKGADRGAHLVQHDLDARVRRLPSRFGPGHAAADDLECFLGHAGDVVPKGWVAKGLSAGLPQSSRSVILYNSLAIDVATAPRQCAPGKYLYCSSTVTCVSD